MPGALERLSDRMVLHVAVLVAVLLAAWGTPVPAGNEEHYLAVLARAWDPSFLAGDWTFGTRLPDRWTFDSLFGALALVLPLQWLGWAGRLATWAASSWGILRLARRLGVPLPHATGGVALFVLLGQSLVGGEWVAGWFEAKAVAWAFLLHGVADAAGGRWTRAAVMAGLAATFHPAVGVVGGGSLAVAALAVHRPWKDLVRPALAGLVAGLPGLVQAGLMVLGSEPSTDADWEFLSRTFLQIHMDAATFDRGLLLALAVTTAFTLAQARERGTDPAWRLLAWLHAAPAALFALGLAAHWAGAWHWMTLTPYRLLPAVSLLAFCLSGADLLARSLAHLPGRPTLLLGVAALLCLPAVPHQAKDLLRYQQASWGDRADPYGEAFDWIAANVPEDGIGLVPPWRGDAPLRARRAQVVHAAMPRYDRLAEWHRRVEDLLGDLSAEPSRDPARAWQRARDRWQALDAPKVRRLAERYGATFLVTEGDLPFPLLFRTGTVHVYDLVTAPLKSRVPTVDREPRLHGLHDPGAVHRTPASMGGRGTRPGARPHLEGG